jgi:hypothetical protein
MGSWAKQLTLHVLLLVPHQQGNPSSSIVACLRSSMLVSQQSGGLPSMGNCWGPSLPRGSAVVQLTTRTWHSCQGTTLPLSTTPPTPAVNCWRPSTQNPCLGYACPYSLRVGFSAESAPSLEVAWCCWCCKERLLSGVPFVQWSVQGRGARRWYVSMAHRP